jgi:hypothetical protein
MSPTVDLEIIDPTRSHSELAAFVAAFETTALPCGRWNHRAHLTIGLWYVSQHPPLTALNLIRSGIQRYNLACGWPTTAKGGYHESLTRFWVWALARFLAETAPGLPLNERCLNLLNSGYADKSFPLLYYSRDHLLSWAARVSWAPPDLHPLDDFAPADPSLWRFLCL